MNNEDPLGAGAPGGSVNAPYVSSDRGQRSAGMTATLTAELAGRVPPGLVAEVVRSVLDEDGQAAQMQADDVTMLEARQRLERLLRARASS